MGQSVTVVDQNCLIDLHLHLDGSISVPMARHLAEIDGQVLRLTDAELLHKLSAKPDCKDLNEYLARFVFPLQLLQTRKQLSECMFLLEESLQKQGLIYAEVRFAPQSHGEQGLSQRDAVEAVLEGMARSDFECGLILCCMRGADNKEQNLETVRLAVEYLGKGVVALDLAGAEALFPTANFADIFSLARELDVPFTIHAGEADGPESVREALSFGAARIGHGVRATEDEELVRELATRGIPLETCPTSEVQTCVYESRDEFPLRQLLDAGVCVTVNSDNMSVSGTDVRHEFQTLIQTFQLTNNDVRRLLLNAAEAAFAPDTLKADLKRRIDASFVS